MSNQKHLVQLVFPDNEEVKKSLGQFLGTHCLEGSVVEGRYKGTMRLLVYTNMSSSEIIEKMPEELRGMILGGKPRQRKLESEQPYVTAQAL